MFKRIITSLAAAALATLGLAAMPASADTTNVGDVLLYEQPNRVGDPTVVPEAQIPTTCSAIPAGLATVRSAENLTSAPGTTIAFFPASDLTCSDAIGESLEPGDFVDSIIDPTNTTLGAGRWMVVND